MADGAFTVAVEPSDGPMRLTVTGLDIDSPKEVRVLLDGRPLGALSPVSPLPALGFLDRFRPTESVPSVTASFALPAGSLSGEGHVIGFEHWAAGGSWDVVDVRLDRDGVLAMAAAEEPMPGEGGAGSGVEGGGSEGGGGGGTPDGGGGDGTTNTDTSGEGNQNTQDSNNGSGSEGGREELVDGRVPNNGGDTTVPGDAISQLDHETEVEVETESESEVAVAPGAAAAGATIVSAVGAVGDFPRAENWLSVATSTSTSDVVEDVPAIFATVSDPNEGGAENPSTGAAPPPLSPRVDIAGRPALIGKGLNEAEAEAEGEAGVETGVDNNAAAAAAAAGGGGGSSGLAATARVASATSASTSTADGNGRLNRRNDEFSTGQDRFAGSVDFLGAQAEAEAETEASVDEDIQLEPGFVNVGPQSIVNTAFGDAESESFTRLSGFASVFLDDQLQGTMALPPREGPEREDGSLDNVSSGDEIVGNPGNLEIEVESEADAEAEARIGFNAAAAAASAVGTQAENGFLPTPAEVAAATSSSTSVFDNGQNIVSERDLPGASVEGERGGFFEPLIDADNLLFEAETESEAEAEVGFLAGAAAGSAAASGKQDIQADTQVASTPYAAAAASASGAIVFVSVRTPPEGEAGPVIATARAEDPECNGVSVAVAVAGVPTVPGEDNEAEREAQETCVAIVEVEVFTDPANAMTPVRLADPGLAIGAGIGDRDGDFEPEPFDSTLESESEVESEAEAEAGYGVAAAAASSSSAGIFSTADAKTSTSTLEYTGGYDF